jgi:large subunit ribosomal protein L35
MPKMKTHKGAKRRFHLSGGGKLLRTKGPKSHFRRNKAKRVKRLFARKVGLDSPKFTRSIKHAISGARR